MKKYISKLLVLLLTLVVGLSLTACDDNDKVEYNKNVPYGELSDTTYATVGELKISEKELYNLMRVNGYNYLLDTFAKTLIKPSDYELDIVKNLDELKDIINQECYGTDEIEDLNSSTKEKAVEKYIDGMALVNIKLTADNIYTEDCLKYYLPRLAQKYYAKELLTKETSKYYHANEFQKENGEDILKDGEKVKNPYYISDEKIENKHESLANENGTYKVIIVGYDTFAEAKAALGTTVITESNAAVEFAKLYEAKYSFKNPSYELTSEDLSAYDQNLVTLIGKMEDGDFLLNQQFGTMVYHIYLEATKPEVEADIENMTAGEKQTAIDEIIDGQLTSSFISNNVQALILESDVKIYDPLFDAFYAADNANHKKLLPSEWQDSYKNLVATIEGTNITVADFYAELEKNLGVSTAMDYFTEKLLLSSEYADKLTDEDLKKVTEQYNKVMEDFRNNAFASNGFPSTLDEEIFKLAYFGYTTDEEINNYYKSQKIWEYLIDDRPENFYESMVEFGKQYYEKYFDLSVKHVLLFVDFDGDGKSDDPEKFVKQLAEKGIAEKEFTDAIVLIMDTFVKEVNALVDANKATLVDALTYVQEQYYANANLVTDNTKSWEEIKKYNIGVTVEDLGSVNTSNASKYVPEFGEGVQKLYNELNSKDALDEDYLAASVTNIDELIKTNYGYHILGVYDHGEIKNAKFVGGEGSDSNDKSGSYKEITVKINGENVTIDAYSSENWASVNQIKIFDAQVNSEEGITDLPSNVKTFIGYFYSTVNTRYENQTYQTIRFAAKQLADLKFANAANDAKFDEFIEIQKRQFDSYADYSAESDSFLAGWWGKF